MSKPTIFFSHSSLDKAPIGLLKDLFCTKTGGAIEVFLSSDGQSIPLGRNWVYRVQEGLEDAALMVVFVTPNSIGSGWVYFETGYVYAKGKRVVPVGFMGIDLAEVRPPIGLLQGFNITSHEGLNNLIALVNEEFKHSHLCSFSADDYAAILPSDSLGASGSFRSLAQYVDELGISISGKAGDFTAEAGELGDLMEAQLKAQAVEYWRIGRVIHIRGANFEAYPRDETRDRGFAVVADPLVLDSTLCTLVKMMGIVRNEGVRDVAFMFTLHMGIDVIEENYKITARVPDPAVVLLETGELRYRDLKFRTGHLTRYSMHGRSERLNAFIEVKPCLNELSITDVARLLTLLVEGNVITSPEVAFG